MLTKPFTTGALAIALIGSLMTTTTSFAEEAAAQAVPETATPALAKEEPEKAAAAAEGAAEAPPAIPAFTETATEEEAAGNDLYSVDFDRIKLRPLVEKDAPAKAIPPDVQTGFNDRMEALEQLVADKKAEEAALAARKMIEDFAGHADLVRLAKTRLARLLQGDPSRTLEAIELYDELASLDGLASGTVSQFLASKETLQERREEFDEANRTILRRLEQPDLTAAQRDDLKFAFVRNLIRKGDYATATEIGVPLVENEAITPVARIQIAMLVGEYMRIYQKGADLEIDLLMKVKDLPLDKKAQWTKLERAHHLGYVYLSGKVGEEGPRYDLATQVLKEVYDDETFDLEPRFHAMRSLQNLRYTLEKDAEPMAVIREADDFIEANGEKLTADQKASLVRRNLDTYVKREIYTPESLELAAAIAGDETAPAANRLEASVFLGTHFAKGGDKEKAEENYRKALPFAKEQPYRTSRILSQIAELYSVETDREKIASIYREGLGLNDSEEMKGLVERLVASLPAPKAAPAAEAGEAPEAAPAAAPQAEAVVAPEAAPAVDAAQAEAAPKAEEVPEVEVKVAPAAAEE